MATMESRVRHTVKNSEVIYRQVMMGAAVWPPAIPVFLSFPFVSETPLESEEQDSSHTFNSITRTHPTHLTSSPLWPQSSQAYPATKLHTKASCNHLAPAPTQVSRSKEPGFIFTWYSSFHNINEYETLPIGNTANHRCSYWQPWALRLLGSGLLSTPTQYHCLPAISQSGEA